MISVLFFAYLKELFPEGRVSIEAPAGMTVEELTGLLETQSPAAAGELQSAIVSVNRQFAGGDTILQDG
ncbi:MAG: MoaD/ThiS family protein, partial [Anaerolineaceae bacterium]